ncbi:Hsp20/alpha crystallin family protein [Aminicella lysinilytica]|uniref:Heat shock protein Hsp20 n=1 Tax=Aminicella lysinilytica TaxID=433323 RepID=A0A4R6Q0D7_9FIRM|nr:Hsp20/alpha crystallin family protein [Aminicella lysinilytica]TDP54634.1 heat shock protein Hsp20 [Aminicella lysinilytica]
MMLPSIFGDRFFDDDFMSTPMFRGQWDGTLMKSDVKDMDDHYELDMDLPGLKKENVKIQLKKGTLTVEATADTNNDEKDENGKFIRRERFQGSCTRSFYVGDRLEQEDIKARFDNGVLKISIPKESNKPEIEENNYIAIED